jgi:uncharacterized protein (DUF58 family)
MHSALLLLDAYAPEAEGGETEARRERFETALSFTATLAVDLADRRVPFAFGSCCPEFNFVRYDTGPGHLRDVLEVLALAEMTPDRMPAELHDAVQERKVRGGGICMITPGPPRDMPAGLLSGAAHGVTIDVNNPEFDEFFLVP